MEKIIHITYCIKKSSKNYFINSDLQFDAKKDGRWRDFVLNLFNAHSLLFFSKEVPVPGAIADTNGDSRYEIVSRIVSIDDTRCIYKRRQ